MNDVLVPGWIKELESKAEAAKREREASAHRDIAAALVVNTEGPKFWHQLLRELAINAEALQRINIRGSSSEPSDSQGGEQHCRVQLSLLGLFPAQTYTDLFYTPGDSKIRCHTLEGAAFELVL